MTLNAPIVDELGNILDRLLLEGENEIVEFKRARTDFSTNDLGKYFSALANEANLKGVDQAWLVFGIDDKLKSIVGTDYRSQPGKLQSTKHQLAQSTEPRVTFKGIHELQHQSCRVVLFQIPPAPRGIPIRWKGHFYARAGDSLTPLDLAKLEEIRRQTVSEDWSAQILPKAGIGDLDEEALAQARQAFQMKHAERFSEAEVEQWSNSIFLDRARITVDGQITRTAILLLGKGSASWHLSPHPTELTWNLRGSERAYEHFYPPFLISTNRLYQRIRNIQVRMLARDQLVPIEISKYDKRIVLEALHNCIAHQDYSQNARVVVTEYVDRLTFENDGGFFESAPDDYVQGTKVPKHYRNPFLAQAMASLNMIDTMGLGIHDMHVRQALRFSPLPDYDLSQSGAVTMTIHGSATETTYSQLLMEHTDMPLADIVVLDRVQKNLPAAKEAVKRLRRKGMIKGRHPNLRLAFESSPSEFRNLTLRNGSGEYSILAAVVLEHLKNVGECDRAEINNLLSAHIGHDLSSNKKSKQISNLLTKMRRSGLVRSRGSTRATRWYLAEMEAKESAFLQKTTQR